METNSSVTGHPAIASEPSIAQLVDQYRDGILRLAARHGAHNVRLFGSVARGQATAGSDLDVLVDFEADRSLLDHIALIQDLEDLLGIKVDVVTPRSLHRDLRAAILRDARPL